MILTTTEESRRLDACAMQEYGLPEAVLMENAGAAVVRLMEKEISWAGKLVVIVCGTGNNGGDGFVIARYAALMGANVVVYLMGNESHMGAAARMYRGAVERMGIPVTPISSAVDAEALRDADILVDALIGTGLAKDVTGEKAELIDAMNEARGLRIAVDVPSGMNADSGRAMGAVVCAEYTVALGSVKRGHVLYPGSEYCGKVLYSAIGIPETARRDYPVRLVERADLALRLPQRSRISHKGRNGFIGIFAGSAGMEGAALLAGQGALYAGGGKIAVVSVKEAEERLAARTPELMVSSLGDAPCFTEDMVGTALEKAQAYDVISIGPGLGRAETTQKFVARFLAKWTKTAVVDADALYAVKEQGVKLSECPGQLILTPHVGEFAHLTGLSAKEVEAGRIDNAISFAVENKVVLVLKGAPTVTVLPDGRAWVNPTGNPGMASGGMGDTLTGIVAALAGQGMEPGDAAACGVYLHGLAGDILAGETPVGYRASELAETLPEARQRILG